MDIPRTLAGIFGLSKYEARIYAALITNGPTHIANIGKCTNTPRTAVYPPLRSLLKKGFISESAFGMRKYYSAIPVENLRSLFEEKRTSLERLLFELNQSSHLSSRDSKLDATLYSGSQGIKAAGLIFLNETNERVWYSFENISRVTDTVGLEFENFYIQQRVGRNICSRVILSMEEESPWLREMLKDDKLELRDTVMLSSREYPFESTVVVTRGLILLINPNQNQFALLIRNNFLANTLINIHKVIWDRFMK